MVIISRLSRSIVFNINVFRAHLEKRALNSNAELNKVEVYLKEKLNCDHTKIFKPRSIVLVQEVSVLTKRLKLFNSCSFGLSKKEAELVTSFLQMIMMSVVLDNICFKLFDKVL